MKLLLALVIVLSPVVVATPAAEAAGIRYYCLVDSKVQSGVSKLSYRDACLKHLARAGWRGLTITGWDRCTANDACIHGARQVGITATRKMAAGGVETLEFVAVTSFVRR